MCIGDNGAARRALISTPARLIGVPVWLMHADRMTSSTHTTVVESYIQYAHLFLNLRAWLTL